MPLPPILYDSVIADFYDTSPLVARRTQDIQFYCDVAAKCSGPILELGCGTGRITMPLAHSGQRITGLDISQKMLERAAEKRDNLSAEQRERVRLAQADMTKFDLGEQFPLIIIPFRPFQHLVTVDEQLACLHCVRRHLTPGGQLIVDFFQTDAARMHDPMFHEEHFVADYEIDGGRTVRLTERIAAFHRAEQCNDVEMAFTVKDAGGREQRSVFAFTFRYFFRYEVEHLLARSGFLVTNLFGDFDRSTLRDDSPEMIFVAETR
ncbi:MAG: class I SAM-dependent methyltransferase [Candidatus Acidiferrum sp.]|jgi:ubiquinone/menaquinone biosynthesis C-methylase UbiE